MQNLLRRFLFHYWYFGQPPWDTGVSPPELLNFLQNHKRSTPQSGRVDKPGRAIDIGCGTGTNMITLVRAGWNVLGVDFAPRAIRLAGQKVTEAGVQAELLVKDATKLQGINGPFDLAFDPGCFHGIPSEGRAEYLEQLHRILAPGGFWLMYGFLKPDVDQSRTGLGKWDIEQTLTFLSLIWRRDGVDSKGNRSSAWFLFQKQELLAEI